MLECGFKVARVVNTKLFFLWADFIIFDNTTLVMQNLI